MPQGKREHRAYDPDNPTAKNRALVDRLKASPYTSREEADRMESSTRAYERSVQDYGGGRVKGRSAKSRSGRRR